MKILYELDLDPNLENNDQYELYLIQNSRKFHEALIELERYLRSIRKEYVNPTLEEAIDKVTDILISANLDDEY